MAMLRRYTSALKYHTSEGEFTEGHSRFVVDVPYFEVTTNKTTTLYALSTQQYGTPLLFWAIGDMNNILDPDMEIAAGTKIKVPMIG